MGSDLVAVVEFGSVAVLRSAAALVVESVELAAVAAVVAVSSRPFLR